MRAYIMELLVSRHGRLLGAIQGYGKSVPENPDLQIAIFGVLSMVLFL